MFKNIIKSSIIVIFLIMIIPGMKAMSAPINNKILLIYDSHNIYGDKTDVLNIVNRIVTESNEPVEMKKLDSMSAKDLNDLKNYSRIVILNCNTTQFNKEFLDAINKEINKVTYISNITDNGLNYKEKISIPSETFPNEYFTFRNLILNSLSSKQINQKRYLMINDVNPFINLNDLVSKIKYLNEQGIPFILNAIPIFENPTFKAMQNFTEVLRYAQASGGYIVLSCPYLNQGTVTSNEIFEAMTEGYNNYINYLVYPIGLSMPNYLLYRNDFKDDLEKSNTMFIQNTTVDLNGINDYENPTFKNIIQQIPYAAGQVNNINSMVGSVAITINNNESLDTLKKDVQNLINSGISFNNPRGLNSEVEINGNKIECKVNGIYLNGKYVQQDSYIPNKEIFKEDSTEKTTTDNNDIDISKVSWILAAFAIVVCIVFVVLTILSKRIDRKKYFR